MKTMTDARLTEMGFKPGRVICAEDTGTFFMYTDERCPKLLGTGRTEAEARADFVANAIVWDREIV